MKKICFIIALLLSFCKIFAQENAPVFFYTDDYYLGKYTIEGNKITPKKGGTTTITLTDSYTNKSFTYNINVYEMPTNIYFQNNKITIKKGERYTIPQPIIEPSTATIKTSHSS